MICLHRGRRPIGTQVRNFDLVAASLEIVALPPCMPDAVDGSVSVCDTASEVCQARLSSTAGRPHAEHEASIKWMQFVPLHRRRAARSTRWYSSELHGRGADVLWATHSVPRASVCLVPVCAARHILARADARSGWLGTRSASAGARFGWLDAFVQHVHSRLQSQASGSFFLETPRFIELPRQVGGDHFNIPWIAGARVMTMPWVTHTCRGSIGAPVWRAVALGRALAQTSSELRVGASRMHVSRAERGW